MEKWLESLMASGPVAIVLGLAVKTLWSTLVEERQKHSTELAAMETRHDNEVNQIRTEAAADRARADAKLDAVQKEYVGTLKTLTAALRESDSHGG